MIATPLFAFLFWFTATNLDGSLSALLDFIQKEGAKNVLYDVIRPVFFGSRLSWFVLTCFALFQILLMKIVPAKNYFGPRTGKGNVPIYKENGVACFIITLLTFFGLTHFTAFFNPGLLYAHFGEFIGSMNLLGLIFCAFLYIKGMYFPSSSDHSKTGNLIFDFYWGTELYPRVFGIDLKQWTNCRFGMMGWPLVILSYLYTQAEAGGLTYAMIVSVGLQLLYVTKFFVWEKGYMRSIDII